MKQARMKIAWLAIQCTATTGEVGSFLYEPTDDRLKLKPVSPVFAGLVELYSWCRMNHWHNAGYDEVLRGRGPCGTYVNRTIKEKESVESRNA